MRTALLALAALLLVSFSAASASIVIHDGQPGIVATAEGGEHLDSDGRVWFCTYGQGWTSQAPYDPPVSPNLMKFWDFTSFVTLDNEVWCLDIDSHQWVPWGAWPGASAVPESTPAASSASPRTIPNPFTGSCRVTFQTATVDLVSVQVFDGSGRLVRQLHDGSLPIGEFALPWDGRDDGGDSAPAGIYFAKVKTSVGESTTKLVLAR
jgi:hypothetical protein